MAIDADVFVIGGGLAGMTAALAAAEQGATVRLASGAQSTLRQATGLIDVLGYHDGNLLANPFAVIADLPEAHPYSIGGKRAVREGLARFDAVTGATYRGDHTDRNALLPTQGGTVKPTARYPAGMAAGLASDERDVLLVGFEQLVDLDAPFVARSLADRGVPFAVSSATVQLPLDFPSDATLSRYARALDADEDGVRDRLARRVAAHHDGEPRIGLPAVLGLENAPAVREHLAAHLDAAVFEVPTGRPSVPGLRLETQFRTALAAAGVSVVGNEVVDYEASGDRVEAVTVSRNEQQVRYTAAEFVLATGGLVGGGLRSDREVVREAVFDCPVSHPPARGDWSTDDRTESQPFATFGVEVEETLRPLGTDGVRFENLRAAGGVLGGADGAMTGAGSGISLATGEKAGRMAGEAVR